MDRGFTVHYFLGELNAELNDMPFPLSSRWLVLGRLEHSLLLRNKCLPFFRMSSLAIQVNIQISFS
jgi:hypothetical protein